MYNHVMDFAVFKDSEFFFSVITIVDAYLNGPSGEETAAVKKQRIDLVYNPVLNQPQLRFSIALD